MKIAVIGAGAIGGYVGVKLALAGNAVTFIARGANLAAIRERGMTLVGADGSVQVARDVGATDRYEDAGVQDVVILAMKAQQVEAVLPQLPHLIGPATTIVPMQNGIPFWYFHGHGGALAGRPVRSVDPGGALMNGIPLAQVLGCVVYPAAELTAPGVVRHVEGERFPIGELDGSTSERATRLSDAFARAGLKAPVLPDIRAEMWLKLWGNLTFNPISALTQATLAGICQFAPSRELAAQMMREAEGVANALGITFRVSLDKRIAGAEKVGHHKTSMLQDIEAGRAPEIDALVGSVVELGRLTNQATPCIETVYRLMQLLAHTMAAQRARLQLQPL